MIGSVEQIYESEQKQTVTREGGQGGSGGGNSPLSRPNDSKEVKGNVKLWHEMACEM